LIFVTLQTLSKFWASRLNLFLSIFFFPQDMLDKNVRHVHALPRLGDVQITFETIFQCFAQRTYLFHSPPLVIDLSTQLATFDMTFVKVFGKFMGQGFWIAHKSPLVC
jgi:hypothetical protein